METIARGLGDAPRVKAIALVKATSTMAPSCLMKLRTEACLKIEIRPGKRI
jgi:hypothetical protein